MRFTTKTEYGLIGLVYMANQYGRQDVFTLKEISQKERYPLPYLEKIFQSLRAAGIVDARHGNQGGYVLARKPSEITLKAIIEALEGGTFDVFCDTSEREKIVCTHLCLCGMKPVWKATRTVLDNLYGSISLEMIAKNETIKANLVPA